MSSISNKVGVVKVSGVKSQGHPIIFQTLNSDQNSDQKSDLVAFNLHIP